MTTGPQFLSKSFFLTSLLVGTSFLAACTPAKDKDSKKTFDNSPPRSQSVLATMSCAYKLAEGSADFVLSGTEDLRTVQFKKIIDFNRLEIFKDLSLEGTVKFVEASGRNLTPSTGVNLYYVSSPNDQGLCKPILETTIQNPPKDAATHWDVVSSGENSKTSLLGLYLPKGKENIPSVTETPTIIVTDFVTKWTLVHEFMHHLFHSETENLADKGLAIADRNLIQAAKMTTTIDVGEKFDNETNEEQRKKYAVLYAQEYTKAYGAQLELLRRFVLEEMVIEQTLIKKYMNHEFNYVHRFEVAGGLQYILSSYDHFARTIAKTLEQPGKLVEFFEPNYPEAAKMINTIDSELYALLTEAQEIRDWAKELEPQFKEGSVENGIVGGGEMPFVRKGCSHSQFIMEPMTTTFTFGHQTF